MSTEYERAKKRVADVKGFYSHLVVYLIVNTGLFTINAVTAWGHWWFYWPMIGWGIAVAIHTVMFFLEGRFNRDWEERKIAEYIASEHHEYPPGAHAG